MDTDWEQFHELVKDIKFCMMTTQGRDGLMHSRPMGTQKSKPESALWFVSSVDSAKAEDLKSDPRVNLAYLREKDYAWVSVSGRVRIDTDRARIREWWQEDWRVYFPDGPEQADIAILHVTPEQVTFQQPNSGKLGYLFKAAKAYLTGTTPDHPAPKTLEA